MDTLDKGWFKLGSTIMAILTVLWFLIIGISFLNSPSLDVSRMRWAINLLVILYPIISIVIMPMLIYFSIKIKCRVCTFLWSTLLLMILMGYLFVFIMLMSISI